MTTKSANRQLQLNFPVIDGGKVVARFAEQKDLERIVNMINTEVVRSGALAPVSKDRVLPWILNRTSMVAVEALEGTIIGHMAVDRWEGCWEIRSVVVDDGFKGRGVYAKLTNAVISALFDMDPSTPIFEIKNDKSNGFHLIEELGFRKVDISEALNLGVKLKKPADWSAFKLTCDDYHKRLALCAMLRK